MFPDLAKTTLLATGGLKSPLRRARGFSIVSAIFLLVTLTALGVAMLRISTVQHQTMAQDIQGSRAYHAARAGIEWGLYQLLAVGPAGMACATIAAGPDQFVAGTATALGGALAGFTVNVACVADGPYTEAGVATSIYTLTSTASNGGPSGTSSYVERQIQVTLEN